MQQVVKKMAEEPLKATAQKQAVAALSYKFLTFKVDGQLYGIDINTVHEIKGWEAPTPMPETPDFMRGVINMRGEMVPIFDLRAKFGKGQTQVTRKHVIIVVELPYTLTGILIDSVSDILEADESQIKPPPSTSPTSKAQACITGLVTHHDEMIILLDGTELFDADMLKMIEKSVDAE